MLKPNPTLAQKSRDSSPPRSYKLGSAIGNMDGDTMQKFSYGVVKWKHKLLCRVLERSGA
eukprot:413866-Pelagomonas_calceolata.AAC.1